jgi:hypothetical protein
MMIKVTGVRASGYSFIVELLNEQELAAGHSVLSIRDRESNHGIIKSVGPLVQKEAGIKEGDIVLLQSQFVPVPNPTNSKRKWGSVELHAIKAILTTEE